MPGQHVKTVFLVNGHRYPGIVIKDITNGHWVAYAWLHERDVMPEATASGDTEEEARENLLAQLREEE